ncbi:MAG: ATP-binding protein [Curvibacter sp.]
MDLAVRDQGPGVPECAEGEVFEKIYSLPRPNSRKCRTGLGLAFVKEIVGLHGVRVARHNAEPGGALATLLLPLVRRHHLWVPVQGQRCDRPARPGWVAKPACGHGG